MADKDKLRFLTGQEDNLGEKTVTRGQVYFAINSDKDSGKIYFDAPIDATTTKRIVMSGDYADDAAHADEADHALAADKATNDSNGKMITETYVSEIKLNDAGTAILYKYPDISTWKELDPKFLPLTGGTITGELYADSITAGDLLVNGSARFVNTIQGNIETANKWKTARGFQITDAGAAHTSTSVNVDGSGNVVLKLPDTITATLKGNADSADKVNHKYTLTLGSTAQTAFDGSADVAITITPESIGALSKDEASAGAAKWSTARTFYVADSDAAHTGTGESVDGTKDITLKLPSIIKASLQGNADTATNATNDSNSKKITDEYLHRASNSSSTLNQFSGAPKYLLGIEAFANGGEVKWQDVSNITIGSADKATKLTTVRKIAVADNGAAHTGTGVDFDGSKDITIQLPATLAADVTGNAATADKVNHKYTLTLGSTVQTAFDGSADVAITITPSSIGALDADETAKKATILETARKIAVADNGAGHTGAGVEFDGSKDITVQLPETIKATLKGNADTATNADKLDDYHETSFYRNRGALYNKNDHNANSVNIGFYLIRGDAYGNLGSGAESTNFNGLNTNFANLGGIQLSTPAWGGSLSFRHNWGAEDQGDGKNGWSDWKQLLDSSNYTNYTVKKDGTGASGTWSITASKATQDVNGNAFVDTYLTDVFIKENTNDLYKTIGTSGDSSKTIKIGSFAPLDADGLINIKYIPAAALERVVVVADDDARKALTTASVQLGDVVKVTGTGQMYFVVDTTKLDDDAGYVQFSAGTAAEVKWSGIINRPNIVAKSTGNAIVPNAANTEFTVYQINGDSSDTSYVIKPNFLPLTGGTITGELYVDGGSTLDSLLVNGDARFVNTIQGNIETANKWLTAKTFYIADSNAANTGAGLSIDGSQTAYTLKLPAKIKATLDGNAATSSWATNLAAYSGNEVTIGGSSGTATNNVVWFNYRDKSGGSTSSDATQITEYNFGNRKGSISGVTIKAATFSGALSGNATTATTWQTARNFQVSDADAAHTGTAVSVNGSKPIVLPLPDTIKASLNGNADTATKVNHTLTYTKHHNGNAQTFNGSADTEIKPTYADLHPLASKTWSGFYAAAANQASSTWYMMSVRPDSWYKPWTIRFKIHTTCSAAANYESTTYATITGRADNVIYANWNDRYDYAHYYTTVYRLTQSGFNAADSSGNSLKLGHAVGVSLLYSNNYTNSAYPRTFELEYYDCDGCTVTVLDTPLLWSSWSNNSSTYYGGISNMNACDRGLQESGDANNYATTASECYFRMKAGANGFYGYNIVTWDTTGRLSGFVKSCSTGTSKAKNDVTYRLNAPFYYYTASTTRAVNTLCDYEQLRFLTGLIDLRYSFNAAAGSLTSNMPLYLVGVLNSDYSGYTLPDTWWSQSLPTTDDGKIYIYMGTVYPDGSTYRISWDARHPAYWYKNGAVRPVGDTGVYIPSAGTANQILTSTASGLTSWVDRSAMTVGKATQLETARTFITALNSESSASFNGTANVTMGISGVLPVSHGGSGKNNANDAANVFLSGLPTWTANPEDTTVLIRRSTDGTETYGKVTFLTVWNYVKSKFAADTTGTYGGTAAKADQLTNSHTFITALNSESTGSFNGTQDVTMGVSGTLPTSHGGTGNTSFTANRMIYSENATKLSSSGHYVSSTKVAINSISAPTENFYVSGSSKFNGVVYINTTTNSTPFYITRTGTDSEAVAMGVDDATYYITYTNDETANQVRLRLINTDTEDGTKDNTTDWSFYFNSSGQFLPNASGTGSIGTASNKWNTLYVNNMYGLAEKATSDASGHNIEETYVKRAGVGVSNNWMTGALEIRNTSSAADYVWSGGAFHNGYANLILRGNATYASDGSLSGGSGVSGIVFTSSRGNTSINQTSDRAFIQYHPYGVTTLTADGTAPTLSTSGEKGILVIGVGNDASTATSGDAVYLQTADWVGLKHNVGSTVYTIPSVSSTTATANYPAITTTTAGVYTYNSNVVMNGSTIGITGTLTVSSHTTIGENLTVNSTGVTKLQNTTDSANSQDSNACLAVQGGISVAKQLSAKTVRIDGSSSDASGSTTQGCTVNFNKTLNCIEFVFD